MVYGRDHDEIIQPNESIFWSGKASFECVSERIPELIREIKNAFQ